MANSFKSSLLKITTKAFFPSFHYNTDNNNVNCYEVKTENTHQITVL